MSHINRQLETAVITRDNARCRSCGFHDPATIEVDHIIPKSKGGADKMENLQCLCSFCNNTKKNVVVESLAIQEACEGFGDFLEIQVKREAFKLLVKQARQAEIDDLATQARQWKSSGTRTLTIRKRLDKLTTSGIVENILQSIK